MSDYLDSIKEDSMNSIINAVGEANWSGLNPMDKTGILTSEICLKTLTSSPATIDFSASVVPLMKVLEYELIHRFYLPYLSYLKQQYSDPADYITANNLSGRQKRPDELRFRILYYNRRTQEYKYCSGLNRLRVPEFTLGNYQYTVGAENYSKNICDRTAMNFYKDVVFGTSTDPAKIVRWICQLSMHLDSLVLLRNESAHAGIIQSVNDANTALDTIVKIDKVLFLIINPSLP